MTHMSDLNFAIARCQQLLRAIVVTEGSDAGVVLLSQDAPCHYDLAMGCEVYELDHFSPLGEALIELWNGLTDVHLAAIMEQDHAPVSVVVRLSRELAELREKYTQAMESHGFTREFLRDERNHLE